MVIVILRASTSPKVVLAGTDGMQEEASERVNVVTNGTMNLKLRLSSDGDDPSDAENTSARASSAS